MSSDHHPLSDAALDQLLRQAHTHNKWTGKPVPETTLRALADLLKMGPTSYNCSPARIVFVRSREAKERLKPLLSPGNQEKTMAAPAVAILGYDTEFYEKLPKLASEQARQAFVGKPAVIEAAAFRNSSLQGGYMILAARALGLDCGPMSGFDNAAVDEAFFPGGKIKSNFICSLGFGDSSGVRPRAARLAFEEFCSIV